MSVTKNARNMNLLLASACGIVVCVLSFTCLVAIASVAVGVLASGAMNWGECSVLSLGLLLFGLVAMWGLRDIVRSCRNVLTMEKFHASMTAAERNEFESAITAHEDIAVGIDASGQRHFVPMKPNLRSAKRTGANATGL